MNITQKKLENQTAIITIDFNRSEVQENVDKALQNYKKNANIPGFRKGHVPMSLLKKQYEMPILAEEVNKLLQDKLSKYIHEQNLDILGNPLPMMKDVDWKSDQLSFDFEVGLAPEINIDLSKLSDIKKYNIQIDEDELNEQIEYLQNQYGKIIAQNEINDESNVEVTAKNSSIDLDTTLSLKMADFKDGNLFKTLEDKKVGDEVVINSQDLAADKDSLQKLLKIDAEKADQLEGDISLTINEINKQEKAEMNQEFFDKLFGENEVKSEDELREKLKGETTKYTEPQVNQYFYQQVSNKLVETHEIDLPREFLIKWLQTAGEKTISAEQAEEEYNKSEKGLRYQLIEGKIIQDNNLQVTVDEIKDYTAKIIKQQMAQYGQVDANDDMVNGVVNRVLQNQDEVRRVSEQLMNEKLVKFFDEKIDAPKEDIKFKDFINNMR